MEPISIATLYYTFIAFFGYYVGSDFADYIRNKRNNDDITTRLQQINLSLNNVNSSLNELNKSHKNLMSST